MTDFPWRALIRQATRPGEVVAVVGEELLAVSQEGRRVSFMTLLAERLTARMNLELSPPVKSLSEVAARLLARGDSAFMVAEALEEISEQLATNLTAADLSPALHQLAAIRDFSLFITTTPDDLLARALRYAGRPPLVLSYHPGLQLPLSTTWGSEAQPVIVQLFGSISSGGRFALSEEHLVEFVCHLQTDRRPEALLDELRRRHLLFLGTRFPDWLMRLFMRTLRSKRFSEDIERFRGVADIEAGRESTLVGFLKSFSRDTAVFDESGAEEFVRQLYEKWLHEKRMERERQKHAPVPDTEVPSGVVFVSYSRQGDSDAARQLKQCLSLRVPAWLDERELGPGDPWRDRIEDAIRECDLFVPVISSHSLRRREGFFIQEWQWAVRRAQAVKNRPFIVPVIVDDSSEDDVVRDEIARSFAHRQVVRAKGGALDDGQLGQFVDLVRQLRS